MADDGPRFVKGCTLEEAKAQAIELLSHPNCTGCFVAVTGHNLGSTIAWMGPRISDAAILIGLTEIELAKRKGSVARAIENAAFEAQLFEDKEDDNDLFSGG